MFRLPFWVRALGIASLAFGAVLVVLTLLTAVSGQRERTRESADRALLGTAQAERQALEDYFARARSVILITAQNPAFRAIYARGAHKDGRVLRDVNKALGYLEHLYPNSIGEACVINRYGVELARVVRGVRAGGDELSHEEADNAFFAPTFAARPGKVFQAKPYVSPDTKEWVISNSTPLPLPGHTAKAIVHFEVTIESFRRAAANVDARMVTRIVDPVTGRIVLDSRYPQRPGAPLGRKADRALLAAVRRAQSTDPGILTSIGGQRAAVRALPTTRENANRWYVVVTPRSGTMESALKLGIGTFVLLVAGLAFFTLALVTFRVHSHILRRAALTDALTALPNRALLLDRAQQAVRQARRSRKQLAVLMLDLNRFKDINDTLGHHQGDRLLIEVAMRLSGVVRAPDTVARLGGDEFAVLAADLSDPVAAVQLAERVDRALTRAVMLGGVEVDVSASIGIALYPDHGEDVETLLQRADVAMYEAKRTRRPSVVYAPGLDPYTAERLSLVAELRRAIEQRELYLDFQPKYELPTHELSGAEALVRWNHPERGPIPPAHFVPIAEHTGLIRPLTDLVLDLALTQAGVWRDTGRPLRVSINLSARSLLEADLSTHIREALERHGVPAELLALEITESVIMEDPNRALTVLGQLDAMGIRLSIDDFGTGYSSLAYLKQLPVAELKIDRSFVMNMGSTKEDAAIVRSTIELGHNLGLDIVAEGVEDRPTLDELSSLACDSAQGYYLARPQSAERLTELLDITSEV